MRPIDKGDAPSLYTDYSAALGDLEHRLGLYCSYCERRLPSGLAVEHKAPKRTYPHRELDWHNFLLSCQNCNSVKGETDLAEDEVLWPDKHNTFLAIAYERGGYVRTSEELPSNLSPRAKALIDLVGLDRHFCNGFPSPARRDRRWQQRESVWQAAERCLAKYEDLNQAEEALQLVLEVACGHGFFSVWLTVFDQHVNVKRALIRHFAGTAPCCFNQEGQAVPRTPIGV